MSENNESSSRPSSGEPDPDALALRSQTGDAGDGSDAGEAGDDAFDAIGAAAELDAAMAAEPAEPAVEQHGESYTDILESELDALNALIADKDERLRAAEDELGKSNARIEREAAKRFEQRTRKMLLEFIEVLDDLERALAAAREADKSQGQGEGHNPAVVQGMELVHKGFLAKLASFGVSHQPALGMPFDPERHDAVSMIPSQDSSQDGKVVAVVREGYLIHDETLRPAGVVVGKASS